MNYRAMITFGDKLIALDIDNYNKVNDHNMKVFLTDGSMLYMHPEDIDIYNRDSEVMRLVEDSMSPIHIEDKKDLVDETPVDKAILQRDDKMVILDVVVASTANPSTIKLHLFDDTKLEVHSKNVKLYSSKSPIMKEVEDSIVMMGHQRIQSERKSITKSL